MSAAILNSMSMRKLLALRFTAAILLVMATIAASFFAVHAHLRAYEKYGHLINLSGRQRMLSQRISLLAAETHGTAARQNTSADAETKQKLAAAINLMSESHEQLVDCSLGSDRLMQSMSGLDVRVRQYLTLASLVLESSQAESAESVAQLTAIATGGELLPRLDGFVRALEEENNVTISRFKLVLLFLALLSMGVLILIAFGIFRPLLELVSTNLGRLETSNSELTEFSYRISHDLRSPVVAALGITEIAKVSLQDGDTEAASESIDHILKSLNRVSITIEDIVSLIKQKMVEVEAETFELAELLEESLEVARNMEGFEDISLTVDCPQACKVRAKRVYLKQTLENLLSNAVKYRDTSEEQSQIVVTATVTGRECSIRVSDNGLGIEKAYREKMFRMFQRFHPTVSSGTGLGLYLVAQNVRALQGSVDYQPLTKGAQFDVSFPTLGA